MVMLFELIDKERKGYITASDLARVSHLKDLVATHNFRSSKALEAPKSKVSKEGVKVFQELLEYLNRAEGEDPRLTPEDFFNLITALYDWPTFIINKK